MNEYPIYEFLDNNGKDLRKKIKKSKNLDEFLSYDIPKATLVLMYAILNDVKDYKTLKVHKNFHSNENLEKLKTEYIKLYNTTAEKQQAIDKENAKMFKMSSLASKDAHSKKYKVFETSDMVITENTIGGYMENYKSTPTEYFPIFKDDGVLKIYKDFKNIPVIEKFNDAVIEDHLLFEDFMGHAGYINKLSHIVEYEIPVDKLDVHKKYLEESVGVIQNLQLLNVKAEYTIKNVQIDRRIFAMMLVRKDFYGDRVFINEDEKVVSEKSRFQMQYYEHTLEYSKPALITLTNFEENLVVKLAKVKNQKQMETVKLFVNGLLQDYNNTKSQIVLQYQKSAKISFTDSDIVKKKVAQKATKTKQRLNALIEKNKELFGRRSFPKLCPKADQPVIVSAKDAKKMDKSKVIEYPKGSGDFYACKPEGVKTGETKLREFPGLKENTIDKKKNEDLKYNYVPCCYPINQYEKKSSSLYEYLNGEVVPKSGGILDKQKKIPEGKRGQIPGQLADVLEYHGLIPEDLLRYGMPFSKQSVLYAVGMAKFPKKDIRAAKDRIVELLTDNNALYASSQSYSYSYLQAALQDETMEIKAENIAPTLEYILDALVVVIDKDDLAIPDNKFGYIPQLIPRKRLCILYKKENQVELIGTYDKKFLTYGDQAAFLKTRRQVYSFYSNKKYKYPIFTELTEVAERQYLDVFGKCRGVVVDGQTIYFPPIAPLDKPVTSKIYKKSTDAFVKKHRLKLLYEDEKCAYSEFLQLPSSFTFGLPLPKKKFVRPFIMSSDKFFTPSYNNEVAAISAMSSSEGSTLKGEAGKLLDSWRALGVMPPKLDYKVQSIPGVIVLSNSSEVWSFLELLKLNNQFKWETLDTITFNEGSLHYLYLDGSPYTVKDVVDYPVDLETDYGIYDVAYGKRVEDGPGIVVYAKNKYGILTKI